MSPDHLHAFLVSNADVILLGPVGKIGAPFMKRRVRADGAIVWQATTPTMSTMWAFNFETCKWEDTSKLTQKRTTELMLSAWTRPLWEAVKAITSSPTQAEQYAAEAAHERAKKAQRTAAAKDATSAVGVFR